MDSQQSRVLVQLRDLILKGEFGPGERLAEIPLAEKLGAAVVSSSDTEWTNTALIKDPQGAPLVLSQFIPPTG